MHVYTSGDRTWRLLDPDSSVARISKLRGHSYRSTFSAHVTHICWGSWGMLPPWNFYTMRFFCEVCCFWPQIPFVHSYLYTSSTSTWRQSHMLITTLAFHIISTRAPVNFTWAQDWICPSLATALDPEAGIKRLRSHQPVCKVYKDWSFHRVLHVHNLHFFFSCSCETFLENGIEDVRWNRHRQKWAVSPAPSQPNPLPTTLPHPEPCSLSCMNNL